MDPAKFLVLWVLLVHCVANGYSQLSHLGPVRQNLSEEGGCAMTSSTDVWRRPGIFTSNYQNRASINLDGVDHFFALTRAREDSRKHNPQIGERSTHWYSGEGLRMRGDSVAPFAFLG
jgi:hypothetical protein